MSHGDHITSTRQTQHRVMFKLADSRSIRLVNLAENTTYLNSYHGKRLGGSVQQRFICHAANSR